MKRLLFMLLICTTPIVAQEFRENVNFSINTDYATITEKKVNVGAEIELDMNVIYVKAGFEYFDLQTNYLDIHGAIGASVRLGMYETTRIYSGVRLGRIFRENKAKVPLFGLELGVQQKLNETFSIVAYGTYDVRQDGIFLYGTPEYWRASGKIKLVIELGKL